MGNIQRKKLQNVIEQFDLNERVNNITIVDVFIPTNSNKSDKIEKIEI